MPLDAYELTLSETSARCVGLGVAPLEIPWAEVERIAATKDGTLLIRSRDPRRFVAVPPHVEAYDEIREQLHTFRAIEPEGGHLAGGVAFALVLVGLWVSTGVIPDIRFALVAGALLVAVTLEWLRTVRRQPTLTAQVKRVATRVAVLMMLTPFARVALYVMTPMLSAPAADAAGR